MGIAELDGFDKFFCCHVSDFEFGHPSAVLFTLKVGQELSCPKSLGLYSDLCRLSLGLRKSVSHGLYSYWLICTATGWFVRLQTGLFRLLTGSYRLLTDLYSYCLVCTGYRTVCTGYRLVCTDYCLVCTATGWFVQAERKTAWQKGRETNLYSYWFVQAITRFVQAIITVCTGYSRGVSFYSFAFFSSFFFFFCLPLALSLSFFLFFSFFPPAKIGGIICFPLPLV